ncbi:CAMP phosphodiesterases class-II:Metallo-beta-lactamase superfamily [Fimbriiglobus ruber]|uniref:cAMP phosphodiesterases class-II:Metallo-beta-lactamase superfamily n=1 Tax=Fimbriiglobus ruber TaxID=1908690 RepID=A0A225DE57_9BACT|nr:CAMP phosphodiesterases class-II:Metallo-beta-lactamase superfamily [Fimbriiglobus ruber]
MVGGGTAGATGFALSTFVIDDVLAVDAGALGWFAAPDRQALIRDVLITHAHIDHVAGLPIFLDNIYGLTAEPPTVHGTEDVLDSLRVHVFNNHLMPDFVRMSLTMRPFLRMQPLYPGEAVHIGPYRIVPFAVDHVVATTAYYIESGEAAMAVVTDTAPVAGLADFLTTGVARFGADPRRLRAVFLEASFPDDLADLAGISKHLTASQFLAIAGEFPPTVAVYAVHIKPRFFDTVRKVIETAGLAHVRAAEPGEVIDLGG